MIEEIQNILITKHDTRLARVGQVWDTVRPSFANNSYSVISIAYCKD